MRCWLFVRSVVLRSNLFFWILMLDGESCWDNVDTSYSEWVWLGLASETSKFKIWGHNLCIGVWTSGVDARQIDGRGAWVHSSVLIACVYIVLIFRPSGPFWRLFDEDSSFRLKSKRLPSYDTTCHFLKISSLCLCHLPLAGTLR